MAAPDSTTWGSTVGSYGRIGIYISISSTATVSTITIQIWFWSKYSVSDTSNTLYFNDNATSATTSKGSVSISTTSDSGGWSTTNQKRLKTYTIEVDKNTSAVTRKCSAKLSGVDRVGGTMKVTAEYKVPALTKYTITYNANGGSGAPSATTGYYGKSTKLSATEPEREGYTFVGWSTSSSATTANYAAGGTITLTANVTLYAVWTSSSYKVTYNANGGSGEPSPQIKQSGVNLTLSTTTPTRNGYNFVGWATTSSATTANYAAGATYSTNANIILYAVWTPWTHTIVFNGNCGSGVPSNITKSGDVSITLPTTIPTYGNNVFKCWSNYPEETEDNADSIVYYYAGGKYDVIQNGGTVTLYAIWVDKDILLHDTGELECIEIIEDNSYLFGADGTVHCTEFIEGSLNGFAPTYINFSSFIEK